MGSVPRRLVKLTRDESLRLLGSMSFGRIVFTQHALPAVRPINHLVEDDAIIIRTDLGAGLARGDTVVAYEADDIDQDDHLGWSVIVTGFASPVTDPQEVARYTKRLRPWVNGHHTETIRIEPELITGYRLAPFEDDEPA